MNDAYQSDDFLTDIDDVKAARKRSSREPTRFRDYQYLDAVYQTYVRIRSEKVKTLAVTVIREDLNIKVNRDAHLIRAIIDATCKADFKSKSRWTRALRYAWKQRNHWRDLGKFFRRNGGITGCAKWFAETRRRRRRKTGRLKLHSDSQIRLLKKRSERAPTPLAEIMKSRLSAKPIVVQRRLTVGDLDRMAMRERGGKSSNWLGK